jgi:hypothetical protein
MHCIAITYYLMDKRQQGLDLDQKALEFLQRVLPPNHQYLGKFGGARVLSGCDLMCCEQFNANQHWSR